mgnify:CR=1 FL=1
MLAIKPKTDSLIPLLLISVLVLSILSPCIFPEEIPEEQKPKFISTDLSEFSPNEEGKEYMFNGDDLSVFSATGFLKKQWADAGYPELVLPFSENKQSRNSIRSCENAWSVGESDNITTSEGTIAATVQRISTNSAIFVENGKIVSSTTLNDIVSPWRTDNLSEYPINGMLLIGLVHKLSQVNKLPILKRILKLKPLKHMELKEVKPQ